MALKLKQYTDTYKGLDAEYYLSRQAPIIVIITNRNTGKTTNMLGTIAKNNKNFMLLTRYKNEQEASQSKMMDACNCYDVSLTYNKKEDCFKDSEDNVRGFICSLSGAQDVKNSAEKYHTVEYIVMDEFLPTDKRYLKETSHPGYELEALRWIIGSVRKGGNGEIHRNVKIVLMANLVDAINPYFKGIRDSQGVSLLTRLAGAVQNGQTNFTLDDQLVYLTVQLDRSFETQDSLGQFVSGYEEEGLASEFLRDFSSHILKKSKPIQAQLKQPIVHLGYASLYQIRTSLNVEVAGEQVPLGMPAYYWIKSKHKPSTMAELSLIDFARFVHYYEDIVTKAQVMDFLNQFTRFCI